MLESESLRQRACEVLKSSALFGALEETTRRGLVKECKEVYWKRSESIDPDIGMKELHIIISGRLKVIQVDPESGRSLALYLLKEGDIFDVFSLLDGKEHVVFPIAMDNMELLSIPLKRARKWLEEHPEFISTFLTYLGERIRELESFTESLVFHDTTTRLANLILKHTESSEEKEDHYPVRLINNLSHESLAELIGSVRSVVSIQMHKLKEEKVIINKRGHLAVKNLEMLLQKCDLFHTTP